MLNYQPPTEPWLDIVYQDEHILIANKPPELLSVPGRLPEHNDSLWTRLRQQFPDIEVVHRLDMATSGLMLFALTKDAERHLKKQFQYRRTHKIYYARVWGQVEADSGKMEWPLICDWPNRPRQKVCYQDGKQALTYFEVVKREQQTTLVRLLPVTGRSHQLRVHMQALGHPIVGDEFYANKEAFSYSPRLQLHAAELSFYHPKDDCLQTAFVPCEFYGEAKPLILEKIEVSEYLPAYK